MTHPTDAAIAQANELIACPWCGGPGTVIESRMAAWSTPTYAAGCEPCNMVFWGRDKGHSIALWNRRTPARELDAEKGGELGRCCYGGMKRKAECESCAAWTATPAPTDIYRKLREQLATGKYAGMHMDAAVDAALTDLSATPPAQAAEAVERVARAIAHHDVGSLPGNAGDWAKLTTREVQFYTRMARAAIGAMGGGE